MQSKLFKKDQIRPFFQPIVCVSTSKVLGYEVLGRISTVNGFQSLGPFFHDPDIPDDEKVEVDRIIRHKALQMFKSAGKESQLFINIQPRWLLPFCNSSSLPTLEFINEIGIDGSHIVIEICESGFEEETRIMTDLVNRYRQAGCKIALDDFGKGFTDLERIISIRPDYLKMRMGFSGEKDDGNFSRYLLQSLGNLCQKIGLNLVLEEVESVEQLQIGLQAGARYYQGFYFSPPVPELLEWEHLDFLIKEGLNRCMEVVYLKQSRRFQTANELNDFVGLFIRTCAGKTRLIPKMIPAAAPECVRIYCCKSNGYQVTPNYVRISSQDWQIQSEYMGRNWSWRPYFFSNVSEALQMGKGVLSDTYLDIENGQKVWTFTYPLDDQTFLFIDCIPGF